MRRVRSAEYNARRREQLKEQRANETPEEKEVRLAKRRERERVMDVKRQENETPEEREERLKRQRLQKCRMHELDEEAAQQKRERLHLAYLKRMEALTPEEKEEMLRRNREYKRRKIAMETPEQREARITKDRENHKNFYEIRKNAHLLAAVKGAENVKLKRLKRDIIETVEQRRARLDAEAAFKRFQMATETPEQRARRAQRVRERYFRKKSEETPEERAMRLLARRFEAKERRKRENLGETPEEREERLKRMAREKKERLHQKRIEYARQKIEEVEKTLEILEEKVAPRKRKSCENSLTVTQPDPLETPKEKCRRVAPRPQKEPKEAPIKDSKIVPPTTQPDPLGYIPVNLPKIVMWPQKDPKVIPVSIEVIKGQIKVENEESTVVEQNLNEIENLIKQEPEIGIEDVPKNSFASSFNKCSLCIEVFEFKSELILHEMKCKKKKIERDEMQKKIQQSEVQRKVLEIEAARRKNHVKCYQPKSAQNSSLSSPEELPLPNSSQEKTFKKFFKCKHCDFMVETKEEIKKHSKEHKKDKNSQLNRKDEEDPVDNCLQSTDSSQKDQQNPGDFSQSLENDHNYQMNQKSGEISEESTRQMPEKQQSPGNVEGYQQDPGSSRQVLDQNQLNPENTSQSLENPQSSPKSPGNSHPKLKNASKKNIKKYFKCKCCDFIAESIDEMSKHNKEHKKPFKCPKCDKRFDKNVRLMLHTELEHYDRENSSNEILISDNEEENQKKTEKIPQNPGNSAQKNLKKFLRCKHCKFMTESKEEIKKHARGHKEMNKNLATNES